MRFNNDLKLDYSDVLICPKRSVLRSRKEVDLTKSYHFRNSTLEQEHYTGIPIMAANMDGVATFNMADVLADLGLFTCLVKTYSVDELVNYFSDELKKEVRFNHVAYSMGITDHDFNKFKEFKAKCDIKYVCVDVANGYTERFSQFIEDLRKAYSDLIIIAGNVVTADQTQELLLRGADMVKVGIGPGSVCTTRIKTGIGYPQLSSVIECADAAHGLGGHVIADGGCTNAGDVAKAFAAGADFVMLGGLLAGHAEGGGEVIEKYYATGEYTKEADDTFTRKFDCKKFIKFYGMSSKSANVKHFGGLQEYKASEGREVLLPYRGSVVDTVQDMLGGLRSTCTYVGAKRLKYLSKCTTFIKVNHQYNKTYEGSTILI